jgi:hypothetical protein
MSQNSPNDRIPRRSDTSAAANFNGVDLLISLPWKPTRVGLQAWLTHRPSVRGRTNGQSGRARPIHYFSYSFGYVISLQSWDQPQIPGAWGGKEMSVSHDHLSRANMYKYVQNELRLSNMLREGSVTRVHVHTRFALEK